MALTATDLFNDATTREEGGVGPDQVNLIVSDLVGVQQMLTAADPNVNNLTDLHLHVIINQLNEEIATVENANSALDTPILGTDLGQYVGRAINDIHRDIIDIAQGDPGVQALFNPTPLPALNTPAAPFHDNAAQTTFVTQWIQDSNHLGQMATTIENNGFQGDIAGLVQQIQTFENNANAFDQAQGGLWSARFWNEFRTDGTTGSAANALIEGLQTQNAGEVNAAVAQLAANSADVGSNNVMADGGSFAAVVAAAQATAVTPNNPAGGETTPNAPAADAPAAPPAPAAAGLTATDLFNDATTREEGGVGPDQVNLIVSDLIGVQQMLTAADPNINNLTDLHTHVIINQLNEEIATVENANSPTGTLILGTNLGQYVGRAINDIHRDIIDIAQGDPGVQALFNPTPLPALNTPAAPFHDSADQTTFVTQWIQDSNHLGQMATTIENNGFQGDIAGLVQQIQTFENNANAFDQAQGGLWSARFWNEFRTDGTTGTAANALIEGLQTKNAGEVNAAVEQLAANSADVGSNNVMADGGSFAAVVAAAQATAVTPNNPGGGGMTPGTPGTPAPAIAADRAGALAQTTNDLEQAGLIFNDAVRLSNGGLWSQPADDHGELNYASMYQADISILQQDIAAAIANGATVNGVAVTPSNANTLTEIQGQLAQLAVAAPNAVGTTAAAAQAQGVLHANEQLILSEIAGDANLQNALAANGVTNGGTGAVDQGFQALPAQAADDAAAITAATAGANLSDIGTVFNAATNLANGGLNAGNITQFDNDMKAVAAGLQNFINNGGLAAVQANTAAEQAVANDAGITLAQAQALTGVHVQTMLDQVQDQINRFDTMYATNPNIAARSTNDNLLDIIDIVQGDQALSASAGNTTGNPSHAGGFAEQPGYLAGTIQHYQDNQAQTDFWSAFIAGANNLNNALTAVANGTAHLDAAGLNALVQQVQGYEQLGNSFDAAQGGIFGARFDNELLGGTLTADTSTALQALNDIINNGGTVSAADAAKLVAAGFGYVADANDVSGNNNPNGGGTYVGTSTTVAGATTTHIADANTTTSGNVDGNEHPTANPASPMNNGFGVTFPAPASGPGGTDGSPPNNGGSPPKNAGSPPSDDNSPPAVGSPPSDDNSPPVAGSPPSDDKSPPVAGSPPSDDNSPPVAGSPPSDDNSPPSAPAAGTGCGHCGHGQAQNGGSNQNGGSHIDADITALLQALQQGNSTAVNNAVTALGNDVHAAAPDGGIPQFAHHHLEHMWT